MAHTNDTANPPKKVHTVPVHLPTDVKNDILVDRWCKTHRWNPHSMGPQRQRDDAPYSTWSIVQREFNTFDVTPVKWPEGDAGFARIFCGIYRIDEDSRRIHYQSFFPYNQKFTHDLFEQVEQVRNSGEIEPGTWGVEIYEEVTRCKLAGCDLEGGWHRGAGLYHRALEIEHRDYKVRLTWEAGMWVPECKVTNIRPTQDVLASFRNDVAWLMAEYPKFLTEYPAVVA